MLSLVPDVEPTAARYIRGRLSGPTRDALLWMASIVETVQIDAGDLLRAFASISGGGAPDLDALDHLLASLRAQPDRWARLVSPGRRDWVEVAVAGSEAPARRLDVDDLSAWIDRIITDFITESGEE